MARGRIRTSVALLCAGAAFVVAAQPAAAAARSRARGGSAKTDAAILYSYYTTGAVPPCRFTVAQLGYALKHIGTFESVYASDFPNAIETALSARADNACSPNSQTAIGAGQAGAALGIQPGPVTAATNAPLPAPILIGVVLLVLLATGGGALALARARGWEPAWAAAWRHSCSEAGYRLGGLWADVSDWLRSASDSGSGGEPG